MTYFPKTVEDWLQVKAESGLDIALRFLLASHLADCEYRHVHRPDPNVWPDLSDIYTDTIEKIKALTDG